MSNYNKLFVIVTLLAGCSDKIVEPIGVAKELLSSAIIYNNGKITSGWTLTGNANRNLGTTPSYFGLKTLLVTFRSHTYITFQNPKGFVGYDTLSFYINGDSNTSSPAISPELNFQGLGWVSVPSIDPYCDAKLTANKWVYCQIPLSAFGATPSTALYNVSFAEGAGKTWKPVSFSTVSLSQTSNGSGGASSAGGASSVGGSNSGGASSVGGFSSAGGSSALASSGSTGGASSGDSGVSGSGSGGTAISNVGGSTSTGGATSSSGALGGSAGTSGILRRTAFAQLPAHNGTITGGWSNGEPVLIKDNTQGKAGEIFGFGCSDKLYMYISRDNGQSWGFVNSTDTFLPLMCNYLTSVQDPQGFVHFLYKESGSMRYARFGLDYTGPSITGFHSNVRDVIVPNVCNTNMDVRATLQVVGNTLVYEVNDNPSNSFRLQMVSV